MTRDTGLIAAPADIRTKVIEDDRIRLVFSDQFDVTREVIDLFLSIRTFSTGIVKPHVEDLSIAGQKFCQLIAEVIIVFRSAVKLVIPVPGRQIEAEFDPAAAAGF